MCRDHLFFVTSRTRDSVFWLHPLLCSSLEPANRAARRVIDAKRARLAARLTRMLAAANRRRPPEQPRLTLAEAKTIAKNLIGSALARAQACCMEDGVSRRRCGRSSQFGPVGDGFPNFTFLRDTSRCDHNAHVRCGHIPPPKSEIGKTVPEAIRPIFTRGTGVRDGHHQCGHPSQSQQ
jgi:hypothetical protein